MSAAALMEALRRKAKNEAEEIWRKARAEAESHREKRRAAIDEESARLAAGLAVKMRDVMDTANAGAERDARRSLAIAKAALADRLLALARTALPSLRGDRYHELFAALAAELPPLDWQRVTVHPADADLAHKQFPKAEVLTDPSMAGGFVAETDDGRVRISNTFEARLEAACPELFPQIMREVLDEASS